MLVLMKWTLAWCQFHLQKYPGKVIVLANIGSHHIGAHPNNNSITFNQYQLKLIFWGETLMKSIKSSVERAEKNEIVHILTNRGNAGTAGPDTSIKGQQARRICCLLLIAILWINMQLSYCFFNSDAYAVWLEGAPWMDRFMNAELFGIRRCGDIVIFPYREAQTKKFIGFFIGGRVSLPPYIVQNITNDGFIRGGSDQSYQPHSPEYFNDGGMMIATVGLPTKSTILRRLLEHPANQAVLLS